MAKVPVDPTSYTFIDFGSGKGAVLFYASELPFKHILGVEFAEELDAAAKANIKAFKNPKRRCASIEAVCADAAAHPLPEGPWVLFFNSPFEIPVWEGTLDNIARAGHGRGPSYLVHATYYLFPAVAAYVESRPELKLIHQDGLFQVFEIKPPAAA
jgi:SAM-dependent methyltransferase